MGLFRRRTEQDRTGLIALAFVVAVVTACTDAYVAEENGAAYDTVTLIARALSTCGDGACDSGESMATCLADCGSATIDMGGSQNSARLFADGSLMAYGRNDEFQLGDGTREHRITQAVAPIGLGPVASTSLSDFHACARKADGTVHCWGDNSSKQIGDGTTTDAGTPKQVATDINGAAFGNVAALSAGSQFTAALKADGTVWCWGDNKRWECGDTSTTADIGRPSQITALGSGIAKIHASATMPSVNQSGGKNMACAIKASAPGQPGTLWCWGDNSFGKLGRGSSAKKGEVGQVRFSSAAGSEVADATDVCTGRFAAYFRRADGSLWSMGHSDHIGTGSSSHASYPVQVTSLGTAVAPGGVFCGTEHVCVLLGALPPPGGSPPALTSGTVWCWGKNGHGQVDATTATDQTTPVQVTKAGDANGAVGMGHQHTCVHKLDGSSQCWGRNKWGQLGNGNDPLSGCTPTRCPDSPTTLQQVTIVSNAALASFCGDTVCQTDETLASCPSDCKAQWVAGGGNVPEPAPNELAEPHSFAVKVGDTWEMVNTFNFFHGSTVFPYTCSRDGGSTWRRFEFVLPASSAMCCDPGGFFRSAPAATNRAYVTMLGSLRDSIQWFRSPDPCPPTGTSPTWIFTKHDGAVFGKPGLPTARGFDYPFAMYNDVDDSSWVSFILDRQIHVAQFNESNPALPTFKAWDCDNNGHSAPNGAFDSAGIMHLVYFDFTAHELRHVSFNPSTMKFACSPGPPDPDPTSPQTIAAHEDVAVVGTSCACATAFTPPISVLPGVGDGCLRAVGSGGPSIAIDRLTIPNRFVVVQQTQGGIGGTGPCSDKAETRFYISHITAGQTWGETAFTGCQTSVQPRVSWAFTPTVTPLVGSNFHVMTTYNPPGLRSVAQVDWSSTDGGISWAGSYMTALRSIAPIGATGCTWGDYNGIVPDLVNSRMYYSWGERNPASSRWGIRSITNPP